MDALLANFESGDQKRIVTTLEALTAYLDLSRTTFVGGIATRYHAHIAGIEVRRATNDLDIEIPDVSTIDPGIINEFLVMHTHVEKGSLTYLVLAHPTARIKVDVFIGVSGGERLCVKFKDHTLRIRKPEDQLYWALKALQLQIQRRSISPKRFAALNLLLSVVSADDANLVWSRFGHNESLLPYIARAATIVMTSPGWIKEHEFERPPGWQCPDCVDVDEFPRTPLDEMCNVLDVVE